MYAAQGLPNLHAENEEEHQQEEREESDGKIH